jgi:hypothetical protein
MEKIKLAVNKRDAKTPQPVETGRASFLAPSTEPV